MTGIKITTILLVAFLLGVTNATNFLDKENYENIRRRSRNTKSQVMRRRRTTTSEVECNVCKKVAGFAYQKIEHKGCGIVTELEGASMCEIVGFGPEDPLSDVCVAIVWRGCDYLMHEIEKGFFLPRRLCKHWCDAENHYGEEEGEDYDYPYLSRRRLIDTLKGRYLRGDEEDIDTFPERRTFKAYERWCGPDWTNNRAISARAFWIQEGRPSSFRKYPCVDRADCACRTHDYRCGTSPYGCCKWHDDALIKSLKGTNSRFIISAMKIASYTRDC